MEQLLHDVNRALADHEQLQMIVVVREPWSIENGFLTPTMKIKRSRIEAAVEPHGRALVRAPGGRWSGH